MPHYAIRNVETAAYWLILAMLEIISIRLQIKNFSSKADGTPHPCLSFYDFFSIQISFVEFYLLSTNRFFPKRCNVCKLCKIQQI